MRKALDGVTEDAADASGQGPSTVSTDSSRIQI
jgi:hypothetical protein